MKITWFGHSAFRLEFGDAVVLIDPFLSGNPAFEGDLAEATKGVTHVLLTHAHGDHVGDTVAIAKESGAKVVTNYDLCMYLASQGVERFDPMNTGGTVDQGGFTVTMVRADHSAGLVEQGVGFPLGSAAGLIVKAPGEPTVYHMGDTDIFSDMALIAELHRPDVVLVPIGDRFTMGAEVAALAMKRYFPEAKTAIPCHYGTFPLIAPTADGFVAAMQGAGTQVVVPHKGMPVRIAG
ncbi:metal-dependent hydrolase [Salinarimonas rosea]|uniref:metal-dependent hydrolase n=1 Tax=Salinarimonas rosea TaxID=552063 RepID=UPI0004258493|nr:metal-dependent hydrolase [Salinarimonas rosea]